MRLTVASTIDSSSSTRVTQGRMVGTPAGCGQPDLEHNRPAICKLACVGKQILEHLLKTLSISLQGDRQAWVQADAKREILARRDGTESALAATADFRQHAVHRGQGDRA